MVTEAEIRQYWEDRTCGANYATAARFTPGYFAEIERKRYELEPYLPVFAEFGRYNGKRVLEIGVGAATDFVNFARSGAILSGIDLTQSAVDHARARLALEELYAEVRVASGEELPYEDATFDLVWSWGVIHHAEHPERVLAEVRRVLVPGAEAKIMLYGRRSWVAYKRFLFAQLVAAKRRVRPPRTLGEALWSYMESPGTRAYTRDEIDRMFRAAGFRKIVIQGFLSPYDQKVIGPLARRFRQDWQLGVLAS